MQTKNVHYGLPDGYLDHWLAAGPQIFWLDEKKESESSSPEQIAGQYDDPCLGIDKMPVERGPLSEGTFTIGEYTGTWEYYSCYEDHRVDQTRYLPARSYLRSWAYNQIYSNDEQEAALEITSPGTVRVWLNGENIYHHSRSSASEPERFTLPIKLQKGANPLFIRFETYGLGNISHYFTARLIRQEGGQKGDKTEVLIPTLIKSIGRRNRLERVFHSLYLDRDTYAREQYIHLHWPPAKKASQKSERAFCSIRLQKPDGRIYAEAEVDGTPEDVLTLGYAAQYPEGLYEVLMMPKKWEYYDQDLRFTHKVSFWSSGRKQFMTAVTGSFESRRQELLDYAAHLDQASVERETARMALGHWDQVKESSLLEAVDRINQRHEGSLRDLLALLGLVCQFGDQPEFPGQIKEALKNAVRTYPIAAISALPVLDVEWGNRKGSRALLAAACQILAAQIFPEEPIFGGEQAGREILEQGEQQALDWMRRQAAWGFADYGSEPGYEEMITSLVYLLDYAESDQVGELAAALLDKLFFTLALNSFQGLYGGTSTYIRALSLKGGVASAFTAIAYLMWGQGILTPHLLSLVPLACSQNYRLPELFEQVAAGPQEEIWSKERHTAGEDDEGINQAVYKTPEFLLASMQDYRPGAAGRGEHVWQATLGPGAFVFTNHPGSSGESEAHAPGYWRGNGTLPRIAQWKDALVCIYHLPETAALHFTHAYFPIFAFDEYVINDGWAFARRGDAYLALTSAIPFELRRSGPYAYRELYAAGRENAWFCQMGRAARDGTFAAFQRKVRALSFAFEGDRVLCATLEGDQLEFGWQGPFMVNQVEEPLSGFRHYENAYTTVEFPCHSMEVLVGAEGIRLNLE